MPSRLCFSYLVFLIVSQIIVAYSKQPKTPGMPHFWAEAFMYAFLVRYIVKRDAMTEKNNFFLYILQQDWSKLIYFNRVEFLGDINSISRHPLLTDLEVVPCFSEDFMQPL